MAEVCCWRCNCCWMIDEGTAYTFCAGCGTNYSVEWSRGPFGLVATLYDASSAQW